MAILYQFLIGFLAATSCTMAIAQNGIESANGAQPVGISVSAEQAITNPLSGHVWELVNAYDSRGEEQTVWSNEGAAVIPVKNVRLWFSGDQLGTSICNGMSWRYSAGPQGRITLSENVTTLMACVGDGDQTMRFELRVRDQISKIDRFELSQYAAILPMLMLDFTDGNRWVLQGVQP